MMRALLESAARSSREDWLASVQRCAEPLLDRFDEMGRIPARWSYAWEPVARHECCAGIADLGAVWLRLWQLTGDERCRRAGARALDRAMTLQLRSDDADTNGALPHSFPYWPPRTRLALPTLATQALADGVLIAADCSG
jgi:hypothetical protein